MDAHIDMKLIGFVYEDGMEAMLTGYVWAYTSSQTVSLVSSSKFNGTAAGPVLRFWVIDIHSKNWFYV